MNHLSDLRSIAVIGAGQMGAGIAQICAAQGFGVALCDLDRARGAAAHERISAALEKQVQRGKMTEQAMADTLRNLRLVSLQEAVSGADFVIEAVTENLAVKGELFTSIDSWLRKDAVIASNTSSISITALASHTERAHQVIGMHFMNPVPVMKLVEIVLGEQTSDDTQRMVRSLAERLGKTVIVSRDRPGFVVNRILIPLLYEACHALAEGVASAQDIDTGARLGLAHPMGPLELADLIGLDTVLAIGEVMQSGMRSDKYRPPELLRRLVSEGKLGRKTGCGFYAYDAQGARRS